MEKTARDTTPPPPTPTPTPLRNEKDVAAVGSAAVTDADTLWDRTRMFSDINHPRSL